MTPITALGSRYGISGALGKSVKRAAAGWWLAGGIPAANCIAAYSPVGAADYAESKINLANPGVYNITDGNAPAWDAANGWKLTSSSSHYLKTGIPADNSRTILLQISNINYQPYDVLVSIKDGTTYLLGISTNDTSHWSGWSDVNRWPHGVIGYNNRYRVFNGLPIGDQLAEAVSDLEIYLGTRNDNGSPTAHYISLYIKKVAIYNTMLSDTQLRSVVRAMEGEPEPAVLVMFDDNTDGHYNTAFPIMEARGIKGTFYTVSDYLDTADHLTTAQAQTMYAAGHDFGNHSKTHANFGGLTVAQIEAELNGCKSVLDAAGLIRGSSHVAYPFGAWDARTVDAMNNTGMLTGRDTEGDLITFADKHIEGLYTLGVNVYLQNTTNIGVAKTAIIDNIANNSIGALLFHRIIDDAPLQYDTTPENFTILMDYIKEIGIRTMTISEWYKEYSEISW